MLGYLYPLPLALSAASPDCGAPSRLVDLGLEASGYAPDHLNFLCSNWTRPTPLPCKPGAESWEPRWGKRFMIFSWWQPLPSDYQAYADAGFNIALTRGDTWVNQAQEAAYAAGHGPEWHVTHDGMLEAILKESEQMAALGILSVFSQVNLSPDQKPRATQAYGNRTGGVIQGNTNITTKAFQSGKGHFDTGDVRSWMMTVPEVEYFLAELDRRNISHRFGGLFLADDTVTQVSRVVKVVEYLQQHARWLIPMVNQVLRYMCIPSHTVTYRHTPSHTVTYRYIPLHTVTYRYIPSHTVTYPTVNQVSGNSAPESLYRSKLYISAPEQYPIHGCINGACEPGIPITPETIKNNTAFNATAGAAGQQGAYQDNAFVDMRFELDHWPLFQVRRFLIRGTSNALLGSW